MTDFKNALKAKFVIKIVIALLLLIGLYRLGSIDYSHLSTIFTNFSLLAISLSLLFLGIVLSGLRWWLLLGLTGHDVSFWRCLKIQLLGSFFSTYLPGAAGGDLVRAAYILKMVGKDQGRTGALFSILADRFFALMGLISIGAAASAYIFVFRSHADVVQAYMRLVLIIVIVSPIAIVAMLIFVILSPHFPLFRRLPARFQTYVRVSIGVATNFAQRWVTVLVCGVISILASGVVAVGIVAIGASFPYAPDPIIVAIAGIFGNLFSAIPITPGGLGVGESVFDSISRELSGAAAPYATIYLAFRVQMLIVNVPGGIVAAIDRIAKRR